MRLRGRIKQLLFGSRLLYRGRFPYFGSDVHFPVGSYLFERVCAEGVFEREIIQLLNNVVQPGTTFLDVGANIGLAAVPLLAHQPQCRVVSIEASPDTLMYLQRTHAASRHRQRWDVIGCAAGSERGTADFHVSSIENGAFDGFRDTRRGGAKRKVTVDVRTLDDIWLELGRPKVSAIKIDVEGAETEVLHGARELLDAERPALVIEWNATNLSAYGRDLTEIFPLSTELKYCPYGYPSLNRIDGVTTLRATMAVTEQLLLVPATSGGGEI
jgi:FkbM family methyltransferase